MKLQTTVVHSSWLKCIIIILTIAACNSAEKEGLEMKDIVEKINAKCPAFIDSETQLDGIEFAEDNTLIYKYTLLHAAVASIDTQQFRQAMWPGILSTIRVSPEMEKLRENKMNVKYHYRDAYGKEIYTFKITPKDYLP